MKRNRLTVAIGVLLVIIFGLWLVVFQVRQSEVALVTRFGKPNRTISEPRAFPRVKLPWPIEQVHKFDKRIQNFQDKFEPTQTADRNSLMSMVFVGWQIKDPDAFFPKFATGSVAEPARGSIAQAEKKLEDMLRSAKAAVVGKHPLSDFISADPAQLKFEAIEAEILAEVESQIRTNNYGIEIKYVGIKKLGFPESVVQEVFKHMTAERAIRVSEIRKAGDKEVSRISNEANSQSQRLLSQADADAKIIRGKGEEKAAGSFAVFSQSPEFANFLLNLEALKQSLQGRATLILDGHSQPFNLLQGFSTNAPVKR